MSRTERPVVRRRSASVGAASPAFSKLVMRIAAAIAIFSLTLTGSAAAQTGPFGAAEAQPPAMRAPAVSTPGIGAPVRGAGGEAFGRVESIVRDATGRPVQVVVRSRGLAGVRAQSRAVPIESLRPDGSGWVLPLRRSEFQLLPAARP